MAPPSWLLHSCSAWASQKRAATDAGLSARASPAESKLETRPVNMSLPGLAGRLLGSHPRMQCPLSTQAFRAGRSSRRVLLLHPYSNVFSPLVHATLPLDRSLFVRQWLPKATCTSTSCRPAGVTLYTLPFSVAELPSGQHDCCA